VISQIGNRLGAIVVLAAGFAASLPAADPFQVYESTARSDSRTAAPRNLRDAYHPWVPPASREAWDAESEHIRRQLLVACGLWPMPEKTPLNPVFREPVDRGDYTVTGVYFASRPGHYVTGSLYRPKAESGPRAAVLSPHGHWSNGRFYDAGDQGAVAQLASGAEQYLSGARYPLQARMVELARMGCVVFHYDMVGYADSQALDHRSGFGDVEAELWSLNPMGLQTWNSIRALDFVQSLPDVDPERIGVTGASGGGTQTFMLCALDPRPTVAFPAVMVSTAMQGGCVCENASYLRQGINNIAIAALTAPRPMALSGANDWTIDIESKGLPELKQVYAYFGRPDLVTARCYPQFGHNYNQVSREMMYAWLNEHLGLGNDAPVTQTDFWPLTRDELAVFTAEMPPPADALGAPGIREAMTAEHQAWYAGLVAGGNWEDYGRVVGGALEIMLDGGMPDSGDVDVMETGEGNIGGHKFIKGYCTRGSEQVPFVVLVPEQFGGNVTMWVDGSGKSHLISADGALRAGVEELLQSGMAVVSVDLFQTGEAAAKGGPAPVDGNFIGYTLGYNRPLVAERVRDLLTVIAAVRQRHEDAQIRLIGSGEAGPWTLLAAALVKDQLTSVAADLDGFSFRSVRSADHPMLLPGALKFGDLGGLAAVAAPLPMRLFGVRGDEGVAAVQPLKQRYEDHAERLSITEEPADGAGVVRQLLSR